jgi:RND family efflux transporter MFP subunit
MKSCRPLRTPFPATPFISVLIGLLMVTGLGCRKPQSSVSAPNPEVGVVRVIQRDVPVYLEWIGTTEGYVNAEIHPKITGYLLKQEYKDGEHVKAGEPMFQIDDREYKAALDLALGDLAQQRAQNLKNQEDLVRYKPLLQAQVISPQEFDHVNQTAQASAAAVQAAAAAVETAKLNEDWTRITSPIAGVAGIAKSQVGDLVNPTTVMTKVSQLDPIKVEFPISEREYLHFADKIRAREEGAPSGGPEVQMLLADGSTYKYSGHFYVANRQVNVQTGTIKIQALFPNPDYVLRPGLYAKLRADVDTQHDALLVPQAAVVEIQGQYQVAVVGSDNRVSMRSVTIGKQDGDLRIITQGLNPGEQVVADGVQKVSDGVVVTPRMMEPPQGPAPQASAAAAPSPAASPLNPS